MPADLYQSSQLGLSVGQSHVLDHLLSRSPSLTSIYTAVAPEAVLTLRRNGLTTLTIPAPQYASTPTTTTRYERKTHIKTQTPPKCSESGESPPRRPPHPQCHRGPPDDGDGGSSRSPIPSYNRDEHRQDRTRAARPAGDRHQPQRPLLQRHPTPNPKAEENLTALSTQPPAH